MEAMDNKIFLYFTFLYLTSLTAATLLQDVTVDTDPCEDVCQKTYPKHTYDKSASGSCCSRGCRLYSILELIGREVGQNGTLRSCFENCKDAYPRRLEETSSCMLGCSNQKPFGERWGQFDIDSNFLPDGMPRMMYPLLYMHSLYSSMVSKVTEHMSVSFSFIMQDGSGRLVIMKSHPPVSEHKMRDLQDLTGSMGTSSMLETNIEPSDNTATQMLRHSQLRSAKNTDNEASWWAHKLEDGNNNDWLTCIAKKSGVPHLLLSIFILLSAVVLIWLCMSAVVTAPEQRLPQKLRITNSLDYLCSLKSKKDIKSQDVEARPLPLKLTVEDI